MDPRRVRSRQKLTSALSEMLAYHPLSDITVEELVRSAGVTRPTFYANYTDCNSIIYAHVKNWIAKVKALFEAMDIPQTSDPAIMLEKYLLCIFENTSKDDRLLKLATSGHAGEEVLHLVRNGIEEIMGTKEPQEKLQQISKDQKEFLKFFYSSALRGALEMFFSGKIKMDTAEFAKLSSRLVHYGVDFYWNDPV